MKKEATNVNSSTFSFIESGAERETRPIDSDNSAVFGRRTRSIRRVVVRRKGLCHEKKTRGDDGRKRFRRRLGRRREIQSDSVKEGNLSVSESPFWDAFVSKVKDRAIRPRGRPPKKLPRSRYSYSEKDDTDFLPGPPMKKTASSSAAKRKETSVPASDVYCRVSPPSKRSRRFAEKWDEKAYDEMGSNNQLVLFEFSTAAEETVTTEKAESGASAVHEESNF